VYCSAMSRNLCTRATPRWQSAGHPYCRWTASYCAIYSDRSIRGNYSTRRSFARWKKSCNDWLLVEERKVKKDCSTCCANWGQ
ncbi:hypothetical protein UQ73_22715, partial [Shigella flexneri]